MTQIILWQYVFANVDSGAKMVGIYPGEEPGEIWRPSEYYPGTLTTKAVEDEEHWLKTSAKFWLILAKLGFKPLNTGQVLLPESQQDHRQRSSRQAVLPKDICFDRF